MGHTIVVTGKGGVGKTTVAALIIRHLRAHATGPILAVDADPDANLATVLGVTVDKTLGDVREDALEEIRQLPAGMDKAAYIQAGLHQVIVESDKVDYLAMGRSEGPGCYCYINNLMRKFSQDLRSSYQWFVMDSEAGLEHISRRTSDNVDHLIMVVDRSPLSLECARRIVAVAASVKNEPRKRYVLLNNVPDAKVAAVRQRAEPLGAEYLGCIPHDERLEDTIFEGRPLYELEDGLAVERITEIMKKLGA